MTTIGKNTTAFIQKTCREAKARPVEGCVQEVTKKLEAAVEFVCQEKAREGEQKVMISACQEALLSFPWPNRFELENYLKRMRIKMPQVLEALTTTHRLQSPDGTNHNGLTTWIQSTASWVTQQKEEAPQPPTPPPPISTPTNVDPKNDLSKYDPKDLTFIHIWATWCKPCIFELRDVIAKAQELKTKGVTVIFAAEEFVPSQAEKVFEQFGGQGLTLETTQGSNPRWKTVCPNEDERRLPTTGVMYRNQRVLYIRGTIKPRDYDALNTIGAKR